MFMAIARDLRLSKRNTNSVLPPHWNKLYKITRLARATIGASGAAAMDEHARRQFGRQRRCAISEGFIPSRIVDLSSCP
jgi:hypothetical protein